MRAIRRSHALALAVCLAGVCVTEATWSIVIVDRETKEVAIGSATCIPRLNLQRKLPIVLVDVGAGAAQSAIDFDASNRQIIRAELLAHTPPGRILSVLEADDPQHQSRQYGIVDTRGGAATFTGADDGEYANGLTGEAGSLVYSIQGNVLTGQPVLDQIEAALLTTPGGIPEKLMAAMEAARDMGGDGRCSCSPTDPTGCGSPPDDFAKSAHVGFIIATRRGDIDGDCTQQFGCANGTYYMALNIKGRSVSDPDPVDLLRDKFDAWRADLVGLPDAVESRVTLSDDCLLNDGAASATITVQVRDWQGLTAVGVTNVAIMHDPAGSAGSSAIGPVVDLGGGVYQAEITAGATAGRDRIAVRVTDATGERFLIPSATLRIQDQRADLNGDGTVDLADLQMLLTAYGSGVGGDVNGDGVTNLADLAILLNGF